MSKNLLYNVMVISDKELDSVAEKYVNNNIAERLGGNNINHEITYYSDESDVMLSMGTVADVVNDIFETMNLENVEPYIYFVGDCMSSSLCVSIISICKMYNIRAVVDLKPEYDKYIQELQEQQNKEES